MYENTLMLLQKVYNLKLQCFCLQSQKFTEKHAKLTCQNLGNRYTCINNMIHTFCQKLSEPIKHSYKYFILVTICVKNLQ